jgi:hypothetical protein
MDETNDSDLSELIHEYLEELRSVTSDRHEAAKKA